MNDKQKNAIKIALNFCRNDINLPKKGAFDYEDVAKQIANLPNADEIKAKVAWVLEYENVEKTTNT